MLTDDGYRQLMKHARRLAQDGHGELAQHLRDAIDLRGEVQRLRDALKPFAAIDLTTNQAVDAMDVLRARRALEGGE